MPTSILGFALKKGKKSYVSMGDKKLGRDAKWPGTLLTVSI